VFKGALVSASSLELVFFFGLIISYVCSYYNIIILCSHHDHHLSSVAALGRGKRGEAEEEY
jgi:hypothetical protein